MAEVNAPRSLRIEVQEEGLPQQPFLLRKTLEDPLPPRGRDRGRVDVGTDKLKGKADNAKIQ